MTVIRAYRPHIVVAIFSGTPRDGHGHHQVSGLLAREAYDAAADTIRYPRSVPAAWRLDSAKLYLGPYSPAIARGAFKLARTILVGRSIRDRMDSRSAQVEGLWSSPATWAQFDWLMLEKTASGATANGVAERSPFDGIDTTWGRLRPAAARVSREAAAALDSLPAATAAVRATLDFRRPTTVVPALSRVHRLLTRVRDARMPMRSRHRCCLACPRDAPDHRGDGRRIEATRGARWAGLYVPVDGPLRAAECADRGNGR